MVGGQFHDEGSWIPGKQFGLFQDDPGNDDGEDPYEISRRSHPPFSAEVSPGNQGDDGHLGGAGDHGGGHDGHPPVRFVFNGPGSHDSGHAAAGADQHGDEGFPRKTELPESPVQDESDTGHVAAGFQEGQEDEQDHHLGYKAQHGAYPGNDAIHNQAVEPICHFHAVHQIISSRDEHLSKEGVIDPVRSIGPDGGHRNIIDQEHNSSKNGKCQPPVGDDLVNLIGRGQFALALFDVAFVDDGADVFVPFVGDDAFCIVIHFLFHRFDIPVDVVDDGLRQLQGIPDFFIPFEQLDHIPPFLVGGKHSLGGFFNMSQGMFHRSVEGMLGHHHLLVLGHLGSQVGRFLDPFSRTGRDFDHLTAHSLGQLVDVDDVAVFPDHIHHVHGHDHGDAQLCQLGAQVQIPFQVGPIHDVQDGVRPFFYQIGPGYHFFQGVGGEGIDAGQVLDDHIRMAHELPFLFFYRYTGPVPYELIGTGQGVEQSSLAGIGVPGKGDFEFHENTFFPVYYSYQNKLEKPNAMVKMLQLLDFHHFCIGFPQGEFIAPYGHFHGVSQRGHFPDVDWCSLGDAHIHDPALDGSGAVEFHHFIIFARLGVS